GTGVGEPGLLGEEAEPAGPEGGHRLPDQEGGDGDDDPEDEQARSQGQASEDPVTPPDNTRAPKSRRGGVVGGGRHAVSPWAPRPGTLPGRGRPRGHAWMELTAVLSCCSSAEGSGAE